MSPAKRIVLVTLVFTLIAPTFLSNGCIKPQSAPRPTINLDPESQKSTAYMTWIIKRTHLIASGMIMARNYDNQTTTQFFTFSLDKIIKGKSDQKELTIKVVSGLTDPPPLPQDEHWWFDLGEKLIVSLKNEHDSIYTLYYDDYQGRFWTDKLERQQPPATIAIGDARFTNSQQVLGFILAIMQANHIPIALPPSEWPPVPVIKPPPTKELQPPLRLYLYFSALALKIYSGWSSVIRRVCAAKASRIYLGKDNRFWWVSPS
jgi:hypothetical protein